MTGKTLKLKDVRLTFVKQLFTPGYYNDIVIPNVPPKHRAKFLIGKSHQQIQEVKDEINRLAVEEWKDRAGSVLEEIRFNSKQFCFSDGDRKKYDGFAGNYCISATNSSRPAFLKSNPGTKDNPNLITQSDGLLYSGAFVVAHLSFWTNSKGGPQMNCNLLGVQFLRKGEAFSGGGTASVDEFGNEDGDQKVVGAATAFDAFA